MQPAGCRVLGSSSTNVQDWIGPRHASLTAPGARRRRRLLQYAVAGAVTQAARLIGSAVGVAATVLLLGHTVLVRADFTPLYALHVVLATLTAVL